MLSLPSLFLIIISTFAVLSLVMFALTEVRKREIQERYFSKK